MDERRQNSAEPSEEDVGAEKRSDVASRSPLDAAGRERPAFVLDFPMDAALEPLIAAFEAGNYAYVRTEAPRLAEHAKDPDVRAAALELRRRIDPDPTAIYLVVASALLLVFLVLWLYLQHE